MKKAKDKLEKVREEFLKEWNRSPEGLDFLGKISSTSYRLAVRETKDSLKGILVGPDSSLDQNGIEPEFDCIIVEEQKKKCEVALNPGASHVQGDTLDPVVTVTKGPNLNTLVTTMDASTFEAANPE